jgi:hypothetical protein
MAEPGYLSSRIQYYDNYGNEVLRRWKSAMRNIEKGEYGSKQLLSDVLYAWGWGVLGVSPVWTEYLATDPFGDPVIVVALPVGGQTAEGSGELELLEAATGASAPKISALTLEDRSKTIPADKVAVDFVAGNRKKLGIQIQDIDPATLVLGEQYLGEVTLDEERLARVAVVVEPGRGRRN